MFSAVFATTMSRSKVEMGAPAMIAAIPPTRMKSTSWRARTCRISTNLGAAGTVATVAASVREYRMGGNPRICRHRPRRD
jgi:membrane protein involved in colicin uptake